MTLQVSNIAGDGRHVVKPREFPRHAEVYAPPDNWRGTKARKVYKEPDHNRIQYMELSYRREERRRDAPSHQHHRKRKTHGYAVWLPRRAQQTGSKPPTSPQTGDTWKPHSREGDGRAS